MKKNLLARPCYKKVSKMKYFKIWYLKINRWFKRVLILSCNILELMKADAVILKIFFLYFKIWMINIFVLFAFKFVLNSFGPLLRLCASVFFYVCRQNLKSGEQNQVKFEVWGPTLMGGKLRLDFLNTFIEFYLNGFWG